MSLPMDDFLLHVTYTTRKNTDTLIYPKDDVKKEVICTLKSSWLDRRRIIR